MSAADYVAWAAKQTDPKKNKYGNTWAEVDGVKFQSKAEANYYGKLKMRLAAGDIKGFRRQVKYALTVNGVFICYYAADFLVEELDGRIRVIDVKGEATENIYSFQIKKKLMLALFKITIEIAK